MEFYFFILDLILGEQVLELHHARVHEHQSWVVSRHQRGAGHLFVPVLHKIIEKRSADVGEAGHQRADPDRENFGQACLNRCSTPVHRGTAVPGRIMSPHPPDVSQHLPGGQADAVRST